MVLNSSQPAVISQLLRVVAREFMTFLRCLIEEIPMAFQVLRI